MMINHIIKKNMHHYHVKNTLNLQKGVVLFFALIALVVMSLAAVALIRSVDTNSLIAGNLSFKQSTLNSADRGTELAITWLRATSTTAPATLNANLTANGYYASTVDDPKTKLKSGSGIFVEATQDSEGNTVKYMIQRMCRVTGTATIANCALSPQSQDGNCASCQPPSGLQAGTRRVMYRITTAVTAPKGTVSYIQTFIN